MDTTLLILGLILSILLRRLLSVSFFSFIHVCFLFSIYFSYHITYQRTWERQEDVKLECMGHVKGVIAEPQVDASWSFGGKGEGRGRPRLFSFFGFFLSFFPVTLFYWGVDVYCFFFCRFFLFYYKYLYNFFSLFSSAFLILLHQLDREVFANVSANLPTPIKE